MNSKMKELQTKIEDYIARLSARLARACPNIDQDDLTQEGWACYYQTLQAKQDSIDQYDVNQMASYMKMQIHHAMLRVIRSLCHPFYVPLYLNKKVRSASHSYLRLHGDSFIMNDEITGARIPSDENHFEQVECSYTLRQGLQKVIDSGDVSEHDVIFFIMAHGLFGVPQHNVNEIARRMGRSSNYVRIRVGVVLECLKKVLAE